MREIIYTKDFASISEEVDQNFEWLEYYRLRDNFAEFYESQLQNGDISDEDFYALFEREPELTDIQMRALSEATAQDYLLRNGFHVFPEWTYQTVLPEEDAFFVSPCFDNRLLCQIVQNTPEIYKNKNVFVSEKHTSYR